MSGLTGLSQCWSRISLLGPGMRRDIHLIFSTVFTGFQRFSAPRTCDQSKIVITQTRETHATRPTLTQKTIKFGPPLRKRYQKDKLSRDTDLGRLTGLLLPKPRQMCNKIRVKQSVSIQLAYGTCVIIDHKNMSLINTWVAS